MDLNIPVNTREYFRLSEFWANLYDNDGGDDDDDDKDIFQRCNPHHTHSKNNFCALAFSVRLIAPNSFPFYIHSPIIWLISSAK
jgi:hypothetical protein